MDSKTAEMVANLKRIEGWQWRILVDGEPAANGDAISHLQAVTDCSQCAMKMFSQDCDFAEIQLRKAGTEEWFKHDASWGNKQ